MRNELPKPHDGKAGKRKEEENLQWRLRDNKKKNTTQPNTSTLLTVEGDELS